MTKIFIDASTRDEKVKAILNYDSAVGEQKHEIVDNTADSQIDKWYKEIQNLREDVYTYYEYVQFKRARFDCKKIEYNQKTGRIVRMEFEFTGKFE